MATDARILQKFDECIFFQKLTMIIAGIWPLDKKASRLRSFGCKIQIAVWYFLAAFLLYAQWLDMYTLWGNVGATTETFLSNAFLFAIVMKYSSFLKYMETFKDILQKMRANWLLVMRESEQHNKEVMYITMMKARRRCNMFLLATTVTGILYTIMPFLRDSSLRDRKYPYFGRYYFDQDSDFTYFLCFFHQLLVGSICGLANYAMDAMFLVCTYHFCAQLKILQNDLMDLGYEDSQGRRGRLIGLIKRHQAEIRNAQALQSMFNQSSFQQVLLSCLMICMNGFMLIVSLNNRDVVFFMYLVSLLLVLSQILFYCQPGNELIVQSQSLGEAIYQSAWINMDKKTKSDLIFMIQRSQRPLAITAGELFVLSMENFMAVVKASMSGLSVLQALYRRND